MTEHSVLGPQGLGKQGSGGGVRASILAQPVMVSGWGEKPGRQVHTGLPCLFSLHSVLGPQGLGSHGSGRGEHLIRQHVSHLGLSLSERPVRKIPRING